MELNRISLLNKICDTRWAVTPTALEQIIKVIQNDFNTVELAKAMHGANVEQYIKGDQIQYQGLLSKDDPILEGARRTTLRNSVAVMPVIGPIFPRSNLFTMSGATSIAVLAKDLQVAVESPEVDTIVLNIDSPGGELTGVAEFAQMVADARRIKPVISYVYGWSASAAYWIGSAANEVVSAKTGEVGSIGVVAGFVDSSEADKKRGVQKIEIVSSQSPFKRVGVNTEEGRNKIQSVVDKLAKIFVEAVADYRGTTSDKVLSDFGKGGTLTAEDALEVGMIDRIGSLEEIISENSIQPNQFFIGGPMNLTSAYVKKHAPEVYGEIFSEGADSVKTDETALQAARAEGIQAENARIKSIETIKVPGSEKIIAEHKFDTSATKESISTLILDDQQNLNAQANKNLTADGENLASEITGLGKQEGGDSTDDSERSAVIEAMKKGYADNRQLK